jgi:DUF3037 family protein
LREWLKMNDEWNGKSNGERNDRLNDESNDQRKMLTYRILRYVPNLMRDEWMNIGVLLEDGPSGQRAIKLIEEDSEFARVRRLNPAMDDSLLRGLAGTFDAELRKPKEAVAAYLEKLDQTLSNAVQFGPVKGVFAEDFDAELDRLYQDQVAPPARARGGIIESTRAWIKARLNDVFRRRRVPQLARRYSSRGVHAAGRSPSLGLWLSERSARVHPGRGAWPGHGAGKGSRLYGGKNSRARSGCGVHRDYGDRARAGELAAPVYGEAVR